MGGLNGFTTQGTIVLVPYSSVDAARQALERAPFDETVLRSLIRAMDAAGDRAGADAGRRVGMVECAGLLDRLPADRVRARVARRLLAERTGRLGSVPGVRPLT